MILEPAIDLKDGKVVRLKKGDFDTVHQVADDPVAVAQAFAAAGAKVIHMVDLDGAKSGSRVNAAIVKEVAEQSGMRIEMGGGIRSMETVESYLSIGVGRVILGTAAVKDPDFLKAALQTYGEKIAVGVDLKDGLVAIKGWTETADLTAFDFFRQMESLGVKTVICTDISRDGAMEGTNRGLYRELSEKFSIDLIASGGVSSLEDVKALAAMGLHGAIIGKAYYIGAIDLRQAVEAAK